MTLQDWNYCRTVASKLYDFFMNGHGTFRQILQDNYIKREKLKYPKYSKLYMQYEHEKRGDVVHRATEELYKDLS